MMEFGVLTSDKDYKSFVATLEAEVPSLPSAEARLEEIEARKQHTSMDLYRWISII